MDIERKPKHLPRIQVWLVLVERGFTDIEEALKTDRLSYRRWQLWDNVDS